MSQFLSVPLKWTGEVDLVKPITSLISQSRSLTSSDKDSLQELQSLRNKMVLTIQNKNYTDAALRDLQNYFDQLGNLELKIPFSKLKIYFKWLDCFDKGSWLGTNVQYTMTTNLLYEKACVLFNIAALSTQLGASVDCNNALDDDLKKAVRMYQSAAGLFSAISVPLPESSTEKKPTPDLSTETALALSSVCLVQGQEVVMKKAVSDGKKDAVLAKISQQTATMYRETLSLMENPTVKTLLSREWLTTCSGKIHLYSGLSHWFQSRVCNEEKKIGEEISRLEIAANSLKKAKAELSTQFQHDIDNYIDKSSDALKVAKKDNDFIYHEKVPSEEELAAVAGAVVVQKIPLSVKFLPDCSDLFSTMPVLDPSAKKHECTVS